MVAELVRETGDLRRAVAELREQKRRPQSRSGGALTHQEDRHRANREKVPIPQENINQETKHAKWNETKHINIPQNQYNDKVVDVSVAMQRQVCSDSKLCTESVGEGNPPNEFGLDLRYRENAC